MSSDTQLPDLYKKARAALKARDYDRASDLLTKILTIDENYEDASRLLARAILLRRRRWTNDPRLWVPVMGVAIICLLVWLAPKVPLQSLFPSPLPTDLPAIAGTPTKAASPMPSSVPLVWRRTSIGLDFLRDAITSIVISPKDPDVVFVGTQNAGVYKSIDGGLSWQPAQAGLSSANIKALLMDPQDPNTVYATFAEAVIYETNDGGRSWHYFQVGSWLALSPDGQTFYRIDGGNLHAASRDGEWRKINADCPDNMVAIAIHPTDGQVMLTIAGGSCPNGIYRSVDGGQNWSLLHIPVDGSHLIAIGLDEGGNDVYYSVDGNPWYVSISHDGGQSWQSTNVVCSSLLVDPNDSTTSYCGLSRSTDGGYSWSLLNSQNSGVRALAISETPDKRLFVGTNTRGLLISSDAGFTLAEANNGLGGRPLSLQANIADSAAIYLHQFDCAGQDNSGDEDYLYRSVDEGLTWELLESHLELGNGSTTMDEWVCGLAFGADGGTLYRIGARWIQDNLGLTNMLIASEDRGETWGYGPYQTMIECRFSNLGAFPVIAGRFVVTAQGCGIFLSSDTGAHWQLTWQGEHNDFMSGGRIYFGRQDTVYVLTSNTVLRSIDAGNKWALYGPVIDDLAPGRSALAVDPRDDQRLWMATRGRGVLLFENEQQNAMNQGLGNLFINSIAVDPIDPNIIYSGTDGGAYISTDDGAHWNPINNGLLGAMVIYSIIVDSRSNVFAATPYGIFTLEQK